MAKKDKKESKGKLGCGCLIWIIIIALGISLFMSIGNDDDEVEPEDIEQEEVVEVVEEESEPEIEEEHEVEEENDEPRVIELGKSLSFSEFTITFQNVTIEDDEATIHFLFRNDSWSDGLHFSRAAGFDVYQNDTLLDETSDVYNEYLGRNASVFYRHDVGIETPISMTYALENEEDDIRIHIVVWMHEGVEEDEEFIIEIN